MSCARTVRWRDRRRKNSPGHGLQEFVSNQRQNFTLRPVRLWGEAHTERVERDIRAGEVAGVSGTPALLINGRPLTGPPDYKNLRKRIEAELN